MSLASLELLQGLVFLAFGLVYGGYHWSLSTHLGTSTPSGSVKLAALPRRDGTAGDSGVRVARHRIRAAAAYLFPPGPGASRRLIAVRQFALYLGVEIICAPHAQVTFSAGYPHAALMRHLLVVLANYGMRPRARRSLAPSTTPQPWPTSSAREKSTSQFSICPVLCPVERRWRCCVLNLTKYGVALAREGSLTRYRLGYAPAPYRQDFDLRSAPAPALLLAGVIGWHRGHGAAPGTCDTAYAACLTGAPCGTAALAPQTVAISSPRSTGISVPPITASWPAAPGLVCRSPAHPGTRAPRPDLRHGARYGIGAGPRFGGGTVPRTC